MDSSTAQVKVIFTTNEADLELPETKRQLLVPAGMRSPTYCQPCISRNGPLMIL